MLTTDEKPIRNFLDCFCAVICWNQTSCVKLCGILFQVSNQCIQVNEVNLIHLREQNYSGIASKQIRENSILASEVFGMRQH